MIPHSLKALLALPLATAAAWQGYGAWLAAEMPRVAIHAVTPLPAPEGSALPFFELMSPLPELGRATLLPKLEYKKGPPDRYLERITVLFEKDSRSPKERIVFYGRQSRNDLYGSSLFPDDSAREAHTVELALRLSQGLATPELSSLNSFLFRPLLLREAGRLLEDVEFVEVLDQAGTPAFLFHAPAAVDGPSRATALFSRRNAFYRVDYFADHGFALLDPTQHFRQSFLTEKRADALAYIDHGLAAVHLDAPPAPSTSLRDLAWPVLLLAAHASVDPGSLDTYFHFAGINALLYRHTAAEAEGQDVEFTDILRNNVLSADLYARDLAPDAPKTNEINRWARLLTRSFDQ